jgi:hypothetical protein
MRDKQDPPPEGLFMETQDGGDAQDAEAESQCTQQMNAPDETQVACMIRADGVRGIFDHVVRGQAVARRAITHPGGKRRRHRARFRATPMPLSGHI